MSYKLHNIKAFKTVIGKGKIIEYEYPLLNMIIFILSLVWLGVIYFIFGVN